jgi:hypothetical protein
MADSLFNTVFFRTGKLQMPTYEIPEIIEVALDELELPADVPVDGDLTIKPLADCSEPEVAAAVKAFTGLVKESQSEIESSIKKYIEIRRRVAHLEAYREHFDEIEWVRSEAEAP